MKKSDNLCASLHFSGPETMGRHRTHRAAQKVITNIHKKLDNKRNRDLKIKKQRDIFVKNKREEIARNAAIMAQFDPTPTETDLQRTTKKKLNANFLERVQNAQTSYDALVAQIDKSDAVMCVLDARDPNACRFLNIEGESIAKGRALMFVITKINDIPRTAVEQWISYLSQTAKTIAVDLSDVESSSELIHGLISEVALEAKDIAVVGPPGVGKTTICNIIKEPLNECQKFQWTMCGVSLAMIGSIPWKGRMRELAVNFVERQTNERLFTFLDIKPEKTAGNTIASFGRHEGVAKSEAGEHLALEFLHNRWKWYAVPALKEGEEVPPAKISAPQAAVLSKLAAKEEDFLVVATDATIRTDNKALEFIIPEEEPESDSDDFYQPEEGSKAEEEDDSEEEDDYE